MGEPIIWLSPWWLIPAALLLVLACTRWFRVPVDSWHQLIAARVLALLRPVGSQRQWPLAMIAAAVTCVALAGPSVQASSESSLRHAQGWILMIDVSRSMGLSDIAPNRLSAAREAARQLIDLSGSRPVAMILYAGDAYLAGPVSFDKQHIKAFLNTLDPGVVPLAGSNLRRALSLAGSVIKQSGLLQARIFVLSDATGDLDKALPAAASIARAGHQVDVLTFAGTANSPAGNADLNAAVQLARAGAGQAVVSDALGQVAWPVLQTDSSSWKGRFIATPLQTLTTRNLSHWLLLLLIPLMLLMFLRRPI